MPLTLELGNAEALTDKISGMIRHITYFGGVEMPREFANQITSGNPCRKTKRLAGRIRVVDRA